MTEFIHRSMEIYATAKGEKRSECCKNCMTIRQAAEIVVSKKGEIIDPTIVNLDYCELSGNGTRSVELTAMSDHHGKFMHRGATTLRSSCELE